MFWFALFFDIGLHVLPLPPELEPAPICTLAVMGGAVMGGAVMGGAVMGGAVMGGIYLPSLILYKKLKYSMLSLKSAL
jgi:hypothetical protein